MSIGPLLVLMGLGAAVIAVWVDARFPKIAPSDLLQIIVHAAAATLVVKLVLPAGFDLTGESKVGVLLAVFGVAFPILVYALLVGFWMLKMMQRAFAGHPH